MLPFMILNVFGAHAHAYLVRIHMHTVKAIQRPYSKPDSADWTASAMIGVFVSRRSLEAGICIYIGMSVLIRYICMHVHLHRAI